MAGVLIFIYLANLVYTLVTHRDIFAISDDEETPTGPVWKLPFSVGVLLGCTALIAVEAELVSDALEATAKGLGLVRVLPRDHRPGHCGQRGGVHFRDLLRPPQPHGSRDDDHGGFDHSGGLADRPPAGVHLAPDGPSDESRLLQSALEMAAIAAVAFVVNAIAQDGETTWFEGVLLIGVYVLLALAFFFRSLTTAGEPHEPTFFSASRSISPF